MKMINTKTKIIAGILGLIVFAGLLNALGMAITRWYDTHTIKYNKIVEIKLSKPFEIKERQVEVKEIIKEAGKVKLDNLTDIEQYICEKWGVYDCKTAIAVARAESGLREDAVNVYNKNGTYDVGIFQVNSIHQNKNDCSLKDLVDAKRNVDCAYKIYSESGWGAWSAWNSGAFKEKYE